MGNLAKTTMILLTDCIYWSPELLISILERPDTIVFILKIYSDPFNWSIKNP